MNPSSAMALKELLGRESSPVWRESSRAGDFPRISMKAQRCLNRHNPKQCKRTERVIRPIEKCVRKYAHRDFPDSGLLIAMTWDGSFDPKWLTGFCIVFACNTVKHGIVHSLKCMCELFETV